MASFSQYHFFVRPVVAATAIVPTNIAGIIDSKKITKEDERKRMYEEPIHSPGIRYAVAVISAKRIDEVNILQATLEGMRMAVAGVMNIDSEISRLRKEKLVMWHLRREMIPPMSLPVEAQRIKNQ